jgi:hypothetical protein
MKKLTKKEIEYWRDKLTIEDLVVICDMKGFKLDIDTLNLLKKENIELNIKSLDALRKLVEVEDDFRISKEQYLKQIGELSTQVLLLKSIIISAIKKE